MKTNFLNLVAYDPIATQGGAKMPQNTGGGNSQTKRATLALPLRYLCAMLFALFMGVGQMWGAAERQIPTTVLTLPTTGLSSTWSSSFTASHYYYHDNTNHYVIYYPYAVRMSKSTQTWVADDGGGSTEISDGYSSTGIFKGFTYFNALDGSSKKRCDKLAKSTGTIVTYRVTNCTAVSAYIKLGKKKDVVHLKCYVMTEDTPAESAAKSDSYTDESTASTGILNLTGLDAKKEYLVEIYNEGGGSNAQFYEIAFYYPVYTVTYDLNGGTGTTPTEDDQPLGAKFDLHDGVTDIIPPTGQEFLKWKDQDADEYDGGDEYTMPAKNVTLTAQWGTAAPKYDITFNNGGHGTAPSATNASKVTLAELSASGWVHTGWVANQNVTVDEATVTAGTKIANGKTAHLSANTEFTAQWSQLYEIAKGTHTNGDITIDLAEAVAGATVTLTATPDEDYVFSAWDVYKTGESSTKVVVTDNTFTMPAYAVTVNATFAADARTKVLYVTENSADATKANDKLYAALKDTYNVKIVSPTSDVDQSGYALVVLHESIGGSSYSATAVAAAKAGNVPVLNTKSYFYNSDRWGWGTPNAGQSVKGATLNSAYCNIASHPLFSGVTVTDGFFEITDDAAAKCMQPIGEFTSGKEGYTLATTPNSGEGNGCAIHELTPAQRGASAGKYLMISVSNAKLNALNANGQKLFQNAAAYLTGSTTWDPISVPTSPVVAATPTENYTEGGTITLTASAEGTSASTVYTWYKGADWATASATTPVQDAATAASDGNVFTKTAALADAGTYWCNISNGTSCDAQASVTITVSSASTPTHTISYDNVKGADMTAYPTEYTEGIGVASFDPLADITGWHFVEWSPASIATDATTDQTITAVWAQVFEVTFNLQGHGAEIAKQDIISGEKATEPTAPSAIGYDFGGWYTDEECTAGNEFDFNTSITAATPLYAKWTAFDGCTLLVPALSGDALTVGATVDLQTGSTGGSIKVANLGAEGSIAYNANGLSFSNGGKDSVRVTLNNELKNGSVIKLRIMANGATHNKGRGLNLYNAVNAKKALLGWQADETVASGDVDEFTYTVEEGDGFAGTNIFILQRQNSVFLQSIKVTNCGDAIVYHNVTSAVNIAGKGTVTLGASSVREGHTTTATYSAIDPLYEFDEWQISGTGASIADASANPAVITMGTADAVVTLKLKAATPKHTVTYDVKGHGVAPASEDVKEGSKVTKPADPSETGWAFCGWYKETTLENAWNFDVNVMGTENITLYAKWEDETGAIKLFDGEGNLNTAKFITPAKTTIEINTVEYPTLASFGSNRTSLSQAKQADMVMYSAATDATKIKFELYNANSSAKDVYLWLVEEGDADATAVATVNVPGETRITTSYYTFNGTKNRSFYLTSGSKADVKVMQVTVLDNGNDIPQFGKAGYSVDFNKGRIASAASGTISFEGATIGVKSEYTVLNSTSLSLNTYIQFDNAVANTVVKIKKASTNKYYVTNNLESKGTEYSTDQEIALTTTGTWYIGSVNSGSAAALSKIEFIAPKCEEPTITPMVNSDLCEGDAFAPLTVSASVSDGGTRHYQWYKEAGADDEAVGTDDASYTPTADGQYYVVVTNQLAGHSDNSKTSNMVTVEHFASAVITTAPLNQRATAGNKVTLSVAATGKNVAYKWYTCDENGSNEVALDPEQTGTSIEVTITAGLLQWYKVKVTSDCGNAEAMAKVEEFVPATPANVTESIVWDWESSAWPASGQVAFTDQVEDGTDLTPAYELLADANAIVPNNAAFRSDMLYGKGQYVWRSGNKFFQGTAIKFTTEVAGRVRVYYRSTGNNKHIQVKINGTLAGTYETGDFRWSDYVDVPVGDVEIICTSTDANKAMTRIQKIEFQTPGYVRTEMLGAGVYGTICVDHNVPEGGVRGVTVYKIAGREPQYGKIAFDEVTQMAAGVPYVFIAHGNEMALYYGETTVDNPVNGNGMYGTFTAQTLTELDGIYYFAKSALWSCVDLTSLNLPANRAYVKLSEIGYLGSSSPAPGRKRLLIGVNGAPAVATGVENAAATDKPAKMLINGQLFILRGEKMYDAKGQLVK